MYMPNANPTLAYPTRNHIPLARIGGRVGCIGGRVGCIGGRVGYIGGRVGYIGGRVG